MYLHSKCVCIILKLFLFSSLPLEGMKRKIMRNLRTLETEGMVNSKNDYQEIINAIAKVIFYDVNGLHVHMYARTYKLQETHVFCNNEPVITTNLLFFT